MSAAHVDTSYNRTGLRHAVITSLLGLTVALLASSPARAFSRVFTESTVDDISHVFEYSVTLQASSTYTFYTEALTNLGTCPADTVLHVVDAATGAWVASDDDCSGSLRSCLTFTTPAGSAKLYKAVVHAYSSCTTASGRFRISGPGVTDPNVLATFGGNVISNWSGFGWGTNDRIELVKLMRTASNPTPLMQTSSIRAYVLTWPSGSCASDSVQMHKIASPGILGNRLMNMTTASSAFCQAKLVVGTSSSSETGANCRVYVNDQATDTDGDGLGNALEAALVTCPSVGGAGCSLAVNPMDTDRDGLSDSAELIGLPGTVGIPLAFFGADPRQKDVFVEVDWDDTADPALVTGLTGADADAIQNDTYTTTTGNPRNPNGSNRIHLHLDIGVNSCDPTTLVCSTTWGYWGGANGVTGTNYQVLATSSMSAERQGVFRYGLASGGGGGQGSGRRFLFGAGSSSSARRTFRHELGHCLGLEHHGDASMLSLNCKPVYFSLMNYAFQSQPSFSNGERSTLKSTVLSETAGVGSDNSYLGQIFDFLRPNTTNVDWNRNGVMDSGNVTGVTRASKGSTSCVPARVHHAQDAPTVMNVMGNTTVAATEMNGNLYVFFRSSVNGLRYNKYSHPLAPCSGSGPSTASCCSISQNDACGGFSGETAITVGGQLSSSVAATALTLAGSPYIALAYSRGTGSARRFYARYMDQGDVVLPEVLLTPADLLSSVTLGSVDPVLVRKPSSNYLDMFYLDTSSKLRHLQLDLFLGVYSNNEVRSSANTSYTLEWPPGAAVDPSGGIYLVVDQPSGSFRKLEILQQVSGSTFNVVSGGIAPSLAVGEYNGPFGRAAILYDDVRDGWELWYPRKHGEASPRLRRIFSVGPPPLKHDTEPYDEFTLDSPGGAALAMYNGHLQALLAGDGSLGGTAGVHHAPYASFVFPFSEPDNDDWLSLHSNMCMNLRTSCSMCVAPGLSCSSVVPEDVVCHGLE